MDAAQLANKKWTKDKKLLAGVILVITSFILGVFGKGLFIIKFYEPVYLITGLSIYAFSWILLFIGIFLVGLETVKRIQQKIHHHVRKTARQTFEYTKGLHKKGMRKIYKKTKDITKKLNGKND